MKLAAFLAALAAVAATQAAGAGPLRAAPEPVPLRADHPLIGAWRLALQDGRCVETYRIDRGGTTLVTSAEEVAETRFTLSDQPGARGFYKWVDTLVRDNGKKDCLGQVTKVPRTTTNFIRINDAQDRFVMCAREDGKQCVGPFVRVTGGEI